MHAREDGLAHCSRTVSGTVTVYGIPVQDPKAAILTRRVLRVSIASALLVCGVQLYNVFTIRTDSDALLSGAPWVYLLIALLTPWCGYRGARDKNRGALLLYTNCSLLAAGLLIITLVSEAAKGKSIVGDSEADKIASFVVGVAICLLQCSGAFWGKRLAHSAWVTAEVGFEDVASSEFYDSYQSGPIPIATRATTPQQPPRCRPGSLPDALMVDDDDVDRGGDGVGGVPLSSGGVLESGGANHHPPLAVAYELPHDDVTVALWNDSARGTTTR